jgi:hypothetical protein
MSENSVSGHRSESKRRHEFMATSDIFENVECRIFRLIENSKREDNPLKYIDLDCSEKFEFGCLDEVQMQVLHALCMESLRDLKIREYIPSKIFKFACDSLQMFSNVKEMRWKFDFYETLNEFLREVRYTEWISSTEYTTNSGYKTLTTQTFKKSGWEMLAVGDFVKYLNGMDRCIFKIREDDLQDAAKGSGNSRMYSRSLDHYEQTRVCMELQDIILGKYFSDLKADLNLIARKSIEEFFLQERILNSFSKDLFEAHFKLDLSLIDYVEKLSEEQLLGRMRRWLLITAYDNLELNIKPGFGRYETMINQLNLWMSPGNAEKTMEKYTNCMDNKCVMQMKKVYNATKKQDGTLFEAYESCRSKSNNNPCLNCMRQLCWARPVLAMASLMDQNEMASVIALAIYRTHIKSFCIDNLHHISRDYQMSECRISEDMLLSIKTEDSVMQHSSFNLFRKGDIQALEMFDDYPAVLFNLSAGSTMVEFLDGRRRHFPLHLMEIEDGCTRFNTLASEIDKSMARNAVHWEHLDVDCSCAMCRRQAGIKFRSEMGRDEAGRMWTYARVAEFVKGEARQCKRKAETFNDYSLAMEQRAKNGSSFSFQGKLIFKESHTHKGLYDFLNENMVYEGPVKIIGNTEAMSGLVKDCNDWRRAGNKCICMICKASKFIVKSMGNLSVTFDKPCNSQDFDFFVSSLVEKPFYTPSKRHAAELVYHQMLKQRIFNRKFECNAREAAFETWHIFKGEFIAYHGINLLKAQKEILLQAAGDKFEEAKTSDFLLQAASSVVLFSNTSEGKLKELKSKLRSSYSGELAMFKKKCISAKELQDVIGDPHFWQELDRIFFSTFDEVQQAVFLQYFME